MAGGSCPPPLHYDRTAAGKLHLPAAVVVRATARALEAASAAPEERAGWWVRGVGPTGPDVLAYAALILPEVAGRLPCYADVHAVLYESLVGLGAGVDRHHRLQLCDEVRDMLAVYLVVSGRARRELRTAATVRGWIVFQDRAGVGAALAGAARHWRRELDPATADRDRTR